MEIAILLLNNFGDILYATPVARQIKTIDFPGCSLTWIVSRQCSSILTHHPFVDKLEIVDLKDLGEVNTGRWEEIQKHYLLKEENGIYSRLFILQPIRANLKRYSNGIRQMIIDAYPFKMTTSLQPVIELSQVERENVAVFVRDNKIEGFKNRILFEFSPKSGQSNLTTEMALNLADDIIRHNQSTCVILSSNLDLNYSNPAIFNAKTISFKENAELLNSCTLLLGCSSGISWLSTSSWVKPINTIQFLTLNVPWFNSMKADYNVNNIRTDGLLELYEFTPSLLLKVITAALNDGFAFAKKKFDQKLPKGYKSINFRTIANELAFSSHRDYTEFVFKNFYKKALINRFYLNKLWNFSMAYLGRLVKG